LMLETKEFREFFNKILSESDSSDKLKGIAHCSLRICEKWEPDFRVTFTRIRFLVDEKYGSESPFREKNDKGK